MTGSFSVLKYPCGSGAMGCTGTVLLWEFGGVSLVSPEVSHAGQGVLALLCIQLELVAVTAMQIVANFTIFLALTRRVD